MGETEKIDLRILGCALRFAIKWTGIVLVFSLLPDSIIYVIKWNAGQKYSLITAQKLFLYCLVLLSSVAVDLYFIRSFPRDIIFVMFILFLFSSVLMIGGEFDLFVNYPHRYFTSSLLMLSGTGIATVLIKTNLKYFEEKFLK